MSVVPDIVRVHRAIISVYDKRDAGLLAVALCSANENVELYSSGGTAMELQKHARKNVKEIADYTGFPEMPGGLVKTLHPKVHAGILAEVGDSEQEAFLGVHHVRAFDMVVVNLYPFADVAGRGASVEEARKNMDIGGVALIEAAAKNFPRVAVIVDPADYGGIAAELKKQQGLSMKTRIRLAKKAIRYLAKYLAAMDDYYGSKSDDEISAAYGVVRREWNDRLQERLRGNS